MKMLSDYIKLEDGSYSNFRYREFTKSSIAKRFGIKNIPNDSNWYNIELLVQNVLQPIRNEFGPIRITSGFRSVELCRKIGSSPNSNHTRGQAADIEPYDSSVQLVDIMKFVYDNLEYRELIAEYFPDGWIHVAYRAGDNNKQLKLKDRDHNYSRVGMEFIQEKYSGKGLPDEMFVIDL